MSQNRIEEAAVALPTVTVIIPAHNEAHYITRTVRSCKEQTHPPERVIVVNDSSTDDTGRLAREAGAEVIDTTYQCKAHNINEALAQATSEVVVCVDGDGYLDPNVIAHLVGDLEQADADATCAGVLIDPTQTAGGIFLASRVFTYALAKRWWWPMQKALGRITVLTGVAFAVRTEAFRRIGGVPTDTVTEDMDMTWALYGTGLKVTQSPKAVAYTGAPETLRSYIGQMKRWAAGYYQVIRKHRRQLTHPSVALVVAATVWDILTMPLLYAYACYALIRYPQARLSVLVGTAVYTMVVLTLVSLEIGPRKALATFGPHTLVGLIDRVVYWWAGLREWGFGKRLTSWTGRQGRKTVTTAMSPKRKAAFSGLSATTAAYLAAPLVAGLFVTDVVNGPAPLPGVPIIKKALGAEPSPIQAAAPPLSDSKPQTKRRRPRPHPSVAAALAPPEQPQPTATPRFVPVLDPDLGESEAPPETPDDPASPRPSITPRPRPTFPVMPPSPSPGPTETPKPTPTPTETTPPAEAPSPAPTETPEPTPAPTETAPPTEPPPAPA